MLKWVYLNPRSYRVGVFSYTAFVEIHNFKGLPFDNSGITQSSGVWKMIEFLSIFTFVILR